MNNLKEKFFQALTDSYELLSEAVFVLIDTILKTGVILGFFIGSLCAFLMVLTFIWGNPDTAFLLLKICITAWFVMIFFLGVHKLMKDLEW